MPIRDPEKYLYDMLGSCEFLIEFTRDKTIDDYKSNRAFRSAVERELQIIGEAMIQIDRLAPDISEQIPDHRNIIGFRHVLVHGYDSLNPETVWNIISTKLVDLKEVAARLLKERG